MELLDVTFAQELPGLFPPVHTRSAVTVTLSYKQHCFHGSPSTSPSPVLPNEFYSHISCLLTFLVFKNTITIKHSKKMGGLPTTQPVHSSQLSAVQSGPAAECINSGLNMSQQIWFIWTIYKLVMKSIIHLMAFGMMVLFLWFYFYLAQVLRLAIYISLAYRLLILLQTSEAEKKYW